jgi:hypothetical protein
LSAAGALLDEALHQHLPGLREIKVLCYVREVVAFLTSFCQQVVKSAHQRLQQFYATPWPLNLRGCRSRYVGLFGREAPAVRKFHPDTLKNGDSLDDFLAALGIEGLDLKPERGALNTALSHPGVRVSDALAEVRPVQDRVEASAREDLAMLKHEFGVELAPVRQKASSGAPSPEEAARLLAAHILYMVEGRLS